MDVKKRQKREVSESEHFDESEIVKMARHVFRSHPINRLQQAQIELNNYEMEGDKLAYNLDAHSLKNDYAAIEYDTNENDHIDIIKSIFCKDNVKSIDSENVANIYRHDYIDLPKTGRKKSENSITFVSNSTIAFEPKSKCYLNPKQIDNYQQRHDIETSDKVKSKKSDNLELDVDNKLISNMRKDQEEKDCDIENNLLAEDTELTRGSRDKINNKQLTDRNRKLQKAYVSTELQPYIKKNLPKNKMRIRYSEIEETSPWTTIAEKDPLEVIDVWDYIDQRGLRHYNIGRPIPRTKLLYRDDETEDESELRNRSTAVTYFHSFPIFYFPLLRPRSEEIAIGNYFYGRLWTAVVPLAFFLFTSILFLVFFFLSQRMTRIGRWHFKSLLMGLVLMAIAFATVPILSIHGIHYGLEQIRFFIDCCRINDKENPQCKVSCPLDVLNDTIEELMVPFTEVHSIQYMPYINTMKLLTLHLRYLRRRRYISRWALFELFNYCLYPPWRVTINKEGWTVRAARSLGGYYQHARHYFTFLRHDLSNHVSAAANDYFFGCVIVSAFFWAIVGITTVVLFVISDIGYDFIDIHLPRVISGILANHTRLFGSKINITFDHLMYYATCRNKNSPQIRAWYLLYDPVGMDPLMREWREWLDSKHSLMMLKLEEKGILKILAPRVVNATERVDRDTKNGIMEVFMRNLHCNRTKKLVKKLDHIVFDSGFKLLVLYTLGSYLCAFNFTVLTIVLLFYRN
ncbi:uncharacterized protein LOC113228516 isoform X2 [Hyposmocoma kahamanoa]|uniref:uncharacterized protein LOC113228516 isoform X2 n=1 Tax=Hyposmocoma kahamanoa TaxID=1477025 RepID=UPI000E6D8C45|nr:uncharacterized protein LOC113228516 isoform X2 [Hyposmocoma kahamanoa]